MLRQRGVTCTGQKLDTELYSGNNLWVLLACGACVAEGVEDVRQKDLGRFPEVSGEPQRC